jgi:dihydrofolate synthase/folylpolyglutamate synthase
MEKITDFSSRMMTYSDAVNYLLEQLPMFQRVGAAAYRADLGNIIALCNILDNPHKDLRCIHIAGTNGKGSVSHFIASALQEQGYKVGLFVSPHYRDYRERIKINGQYISKPFITKFVNDNLEKFKTVNASFFEITTAMAFAYYKAKKVDYAIIETGMGGRLDSTNIISPLLSVITNISFDHVQYLGNTLATHSRRESRNYKTTNACGDWRNPTTNKNRVHAHRQSEKQSDHICRPI